MDQVDAVPLPGTDGAVDPFFSPHGQWIGFGTESALKKVSATAAASPMVIGPVREMLGATWTTDDTIVLSTLNHGLQRVSATGGPQTPMTTLDGRRHDRDHHNPELLPGGEALLFTIHEEGESGDVFRVGVQSLASGQHRVLIDQGFDAHYLPTGHLVYASGNSVLAVPFNPRTLEVTGNPVKPYVTITRSPVLTTSLAVRFLLRRSRGAAFFAIKRVDESTSNTISF